MHRSNHSRFRRSILAVFFLFLNVICIASPVVKNATDDDKPVITLLYGQDIHFVEPDENQLTRSSFVNRFFSRSAASLKNHNGTENIYRYSSVLMAQKCSNSIIAVSSLLQKPGYYSCLFLYTLF